ncbi:hypothetical protein JI739_17025 [Ramlibacter sp. AW1]|uniref:Uncharacterized protein n=1 Tax=Ramlibacter aurantiacus TaxID=2801330 RepID=A0A936ZLL5_9BURK|nr:hypothetical protein [Ramlibacter aurantiacus]MBL0422057.1 hypothetical protein [Ramlibacter aurantiacus]
MPTPNYGYEKRQKELAKRKKKEDKLRAKAERKSGSPATDGTDPAAPEPFAGSAQDSSSLPPQSKAG